MSLEQKMIHSYGPFEFADVYRPFANNFLVLLRRCGNLGDRTSALFNTAVHFQNYRRV